jgi:hypothetical protein
MILFWVFSMVSGRRCKNAPPINPPAEKPMSKNKISSKRFSFSNSEKMPIRDIKLTMMLASNDQIKLTILFLIF